MTQFGVQCLNKECAGAQWLGVFVRIHLFTGEIAMHLLYGFDPLISQDTLQNFNYVHQSLGYTNKQIQKIDTDLQVKCGICGDFLPFWSHPAQYQMISYPWFSLEQKKNTNCAM